jgi:hypothetical protein
MPMVVREGFTKLKAIWRAEILHLLPPFEWAILGEKVRILEKDVI